MVSMNETGSLANGFNTSTTVRILADARRKEVKATQNLSIIVLFFILCWMPLYTINCIQAFCENCHVPDLVLNSCIILSHLNSAGNPLLYAYRLSDFRAAFRGMLFGAFTSSSENVILGGRTSESSKQQPMISISFNPRKHKFSQDSRRLFKFGKEPNVDMRLTRMRHTVDDSSANSNSNDRYFGSTRRNVEPEENNYAYLNSIYLDVENLEGFSNYRLKRKRIHSALDDSSYVLMVNDETSSQDGANRGTDFLKPDAMLDSKKKLLQRRHSTNI